MPTQARKFPPMLHRASAEIGAVEARNSVSVMSLRPLPQTYAMKDDDRESNAHAGTKIPTDAAPGVCRGADWRMRARLRLLKMHYESRVGHLGGNLSALDLLLSLYHDILTADDQFVLSKGHAAGALYVTLWSMGRLTEADLKP